MKSPAKFRVRLSAFITSIMALLLVVPVAQAAFSIVSNIQITPDPFYYEIPGANPPATVNISYDYNSGGYATADITEQIKDKDGNVVYYWGNNAGVDNQSDASPGNTHPVNLTWDGKGNTGQYDGQYVPDGDYTFYVLSHTASPPDAEGSKTFRVERAVSSTISLLSQPPSIYYTSGGGDYTLNYNLLVGSGSVVAVRLKIKGPLNNNPVEQIVKTNSNSTDGNYTIFWNGQINNNTAAAGDYTWTITPTSSINGYAVDGNILTGDFKVSNQAAPSPTLGNLTATPNPYDPDAGSMTFSYALNNSLGYTTVNAAVYDSGDLNAALKNWSYTNQASGTNTIVWDGKDSGSKKVAEGSYIFKVWGTDGNFNLVPQQVGFTVIKTTPTPPPPAQNCAGFTDVPANHPDCAAIEYVKSIGAMTGNPDGTFAPDDLLQRDQIAKIVLETFNLFSSQNNYCGGTDPFPDVTDTAWSYQYVCRGKDLGMITGYLAGADAGYYRPARSVNRVEFLALLLRNVNETMPGVNSTSYDDVPSGQWFSGYAKYSYDNSLFTGNNLYPTNFTTRVEVAKVIYKLNQLGKI